MNAAPTIPTLPERLSLIFGALCRAAAARAGRDRRAAPLVLILWPYLNRLAARLVALLGRPARRGAAQPVAGPVATRTRASRPRLPGGFAWLIVWAPEMASLGSQLAYVLADPEMAGLLDADPRIGRCLRPLCRMLGIAPGPDVPPSLFPPPASPDAKPPPTPQEPAAGLQPTRPAWPHRGAMALDPFLARA